MHNYFAKYLIIIVMSLIGGICLTQPTHALGDKPKLYGKNEFNTTQGQISQEIFPLYGFEGQVKVGYYDKSWVDAHAKLLNEQWNWWFVYSKY